MPSPSKRQNSSILTQLAERSQIDFEMEFFASLLKRVPDFAEVLRAQASNLTAKGQLKEGLLVDRLLVEVRPKDATARYNLACRYAVLKQRELALTTLRHAIELGYRDFRYMIQDNDLNAIHKDPRFRQMLLEFGAI